LQCGPHAALLEERVAQRLANLREGAFCPRRRWVGDTDRQQPERRRDIHLGRGHRLAKIVRDCRDELAGDDQSRDALEIWVASFRVKSVMNLHNSIVHHLVQDAHWLLGQWYEAPEQRDDETR